MTNKLLFEDYIGPYGNCILVRSILGKSHVSSLEVWQHSKEEADANTYMERMKSVIRNDMTIFCGSKSNSSLVLI